MTAAIFNAVVGLSRSAVRGSSRELSYRSAPNSGAFSCTLYDSGTSDLSALR
jgi:hypothetical protein